MYVMGSLKLPATFLMFASTFALFMSLFGLSFPYSAANQCPKRVFFQVRITTNEKKNQTCETEFHQDIQTQRKRVENMIPSEVFLTKFEVFG